MGRGASGVTGACMTRDIPACYLCGGEASRVLCEYRRLDRYEQALGLSEDGYLRRWLACASCGLHYSFSNRRDTLDALYATSYRDESVQRVSLRQRFESVVSLPYERSENKQRVRALRAMLAEAGRMLPAAGDPRRRVLDIGGGTGVFLYEFLDQEWKGYIVEPLAATCEFIREMMPAVTVVNGYFAAGLFPCRFHLVTLVQTLEHIEDPLTLLSAVRDELERDGFLFIECPDSLNFRVLTPDHDVFGSSHRFMFDPASLAALVARSGLSPLLVRRDKAVRGHINVTCLAVRDDAAVR